MDIKEATGWLNGSLSMVNIIDLHPLENHEERVARANAAMMEQAICVLKADEAMRRRHWAVILKAEAVQERDGRWVVLWGAVTAYGNTPMEAIEAFDVAMNDNTGLCNAADQQHEGAQRLLDEMCRDFKPQSTDQKILSALLEAAEKQEIGDFPKPRLVKTSLETNTCDWCGETIEQGSPYWFRNDYDAQVTVRMHPECYEAPNVAELLRKRMLPPMGTYRRGCSHGNQ